MSAGSTPCFQDDPFTQLDLDQLLDRLATGSARQKRSTAAAIEEAADELSAKASEALKGYSRDGDDWEPAGSSDSSALSSETLAAIPEASSGWFNTPSASGIDFNSLQLALCGRLRRLIVSQLRSA